MSVETLIPYAKNARTHSDEQVAQIAGSIKEFGFNNPVLIDKENSIIAGHGRLMAARKLGMDKVPVVQLDHMTEAQRKAYVLADNRIALNSGWDTGMLSLELQELKDDIDLSLLGFDADELDALLNPIEETEGLTDEDAVPDVPDEPKTKLGDIYILGNHRLMCGDSTSIDDVDKLMDGQKADMVFTDPPYGVSYTGGLQNSKDGLKGDAREMIKNDDIDLYEEAVTIASIYCHGAVFMFYADTVPFGLYRGIENVGGEVVALLIWKKKGDRLNFIGSTAENRIWEEDKEGVNKLHPTQKPVAIPKRAIGNHKADIVLDMFGGSGSTLIACEELGRKARVMELDPKYCDVIVKRWEDFTGKKAILSELEKE